MFNLTFPTILGELEMRAIITTTSQVVELVVIDGNSKPIHTSYPESLEVAERFLQDNRIVDVQYENLSI